MEEDLRSVLTQLLPRLRRFGIALTGSALEADELVQRACERALQRSGQLRNLSRLDGWLYGIMRNLWIDETRSRRVRRHEEIAVAEMVAGENGEAVVESRQTLRAVRDAVQALPTDRRAVLMLVCVDGMSYRETADILGIPIGTVMSRLARGRSELHERLFGRPDREGTVLPIGNNHPKRVR